MRRSILALMCIVGLVIAGPASADDVTGSEREMRTLNCPQGQPVPSNQEPPGPGECVDDPNTPEREDQGTYEGWVWTNEVKCDADNQGVPGVLTADGAQQGTGGEMGLCTDGALPIHGRLVVGGSMESGGMYVYIDGDKTNPGPLGGWARADVGLTQSVRCGDDGGRMDASMPTGADGQDDCG